MGDICSPRSFRCIGNNDDGSVGVVGGEGRGVDSGLLGLFPHGTEPGVLVPDRSSEAVFLVRSEVFAGDDVLVFQSHNGRDRPEDVREPTDVLPVKVG